MLSYTVDVAHAKNWFDKNMNKSVRNDILYEKCDWFEKSIKYIGC